MDRWLRSSVLFTLLAIPVLISDLLGGLAMASAGPPSQVREVVQLTDGWRFKQDDAIRGAEAPAFSDQTWSLVSVPHTWNRVGYYLIDPATHLNTPTNVNKTQGVGWYRLSFTPPAEFKGKRAWLQFDAASRMATVWLNGMYLGEHKGGFSRFRLDASAALKPGETNVLVVKTDNSKPAPGASTEDILPLSGDFFVHGGLYRSVSLIATNPVHVDMLDFGSSGVYATTMSIDGARAQVRVRTRLRNDDARSSRISVRVRLIDTAGKSIAEQTQQLSLRSQADTEVIQNLVVANARLWRGVADPHLYKLQVELRTLDNRVLDRVEQNFGIRQMRMDPDKGFLLNGEPLQLRGVGYHQDIEGKGWAVSAEDVAADLELLREMGVNTLRLTHYQHGQTIHELADRYGLILWDEIPLVSVWTLERGQKEATPALRANVRQQLQELIRQNFNHASVATWGIANELDFGSALPTFLTSSGGEPPDPLPLLHELNALAKAEDPSRATSLAACCEARQHAPGVNVPATASAVDLGGANRYFGWYYDKPASLETHLETLRSLRPQQPLAVTEYGAGGAISMHTDNPHGGPVDFRGRAQPEEYMSYVHEGNWAVLKTKPYLWATWLWCGFDFATTTRREGDSDDINTKGLITYDRKVKKDPFYFYKANWTTTPTVHINSRRYIDRAYVRTDVRVYSNAPVTELLLNGQSLGVMSDCPDKVCIWRNVSLATGNNDVVAKGRLASNEAEDRVTWRLAPETLENVRIDSGSLIGRTTPQANFGSDTFFEGGAAGSVNVPADYGRAAENKKIAGAENSEIAASYREGDFVYRIPLDNGRYSVKLTFVEPAAVTGERSFDVLANSARKISNLDIAAAAGKPLVAVTRSFETQVNNGALELQFKPLKGKAIVSAVEVSRHP